MKHRFIHIGRNERGNGHGNKTWRVWIFFELHFFVNSWKVLIDTSCQRLTEIDQNFQAQYNESPKFYKAKFKWYITLHYLYQIKYYTKKRKYLIAIEYIVCIEMIGYWVYLAKYFRETKKTQIARLISLQEN